MEKYISEMFTHSYLKNLNLKFDEDLVDFVTNADLFNELELEEYDNINEGILQDAYDYVHELADGRVDIYYYSIRKWAVDNWTHVENAMDEGMTEGVTDYHNLIQIGQYHMHYNDLMSELDNLIEEIKDDAREYYEQQRIELEV